jgi:hypothetical protein
LVHIQHIKKDLRKGKKQGERERERGWRELSFGERKKAGTLKEKMKY